MAPTLVLAWGNPSRGDDALGPLLAEAVAAHSWPGVEVLTDFQLQVEHVLDLLGRQRVLLVDASREAPAPFVVRRLEAPGRGVRFGSHALSPQALLQTYADYCTPQAVVWPEVWLLGIRGDTWGLGEPLSPAARLHLVAAQRWVETWLQDRF